MSVDHWAYKLPYRPPAAPSGPGQTLANLGAHASEESSPSQQALAPAIASQKAARLRTLLSALFSVTPEANRLPCFSRSVQGPLSFPLRVAAWDILAPILPQLVPQSLPFQQLQVL